MGGRQLRVRRPMGRHRDDDWIPYPHVLPLDLSVVLRWPAHAPEVRRRHCSVFGEDVDAC